jgi:DNA replication protein DnaC
LDDLGQAPLTDLGHRCVWQLVSGRYDACLPTLITTNASDAQLEERLSPAIVSRLYEMTRGLELTASDYRLEMAGRAASTPVRPAKAAGGLHRVK